METAIYVRLSRDTEQTGLAVKRQETDCRALCEQRGWADVELYADNDLSAYSGKRRPAYERMLADLERGSVKRVVVWHPDRLHRAPRELEDFVDVIERAKAEVFTVTAGQYDLSTAEGRFAARIVGAVARKESEDKSRRLRRKHKELAERGKLAGGGARGYGYRRVYDPTGVHILRLEIDDDEAVVVRDVVARFLAGESLRSLATDLNARGVPAVKGGDWMPTSLRQLLESARISGQRTHLGRLYPAEWPAIIDPTDTIRVRALLAANAQKSTRSPRSYLLAGLTRCARCGGRMDGNTVKSDKGLAGAKRKYRCFSGPGRPNCGSTVITRDPFEALVVEAVLQVVDGPRLDAMIRAHTSNSKRGKTALAVVTAAEDQLAELAAAYGDNVISMAEWTVARGRIEQRAEAARAKLADDATIAPLVNLVGRRGTIRAEWPNMSFAQQHAVLAALIDHITVAPSTRPRGSRTFEPGRVDIKWRV